MSAPVEASACGKVILLGEHAVVYGRPALALPVCGLRARVRAEPLPEGSGCWIAALDLPETLRLSTAPPDHPLALAVRLALAHLGLPEPDLRLVLRSELPIAGGLGSGAAVSAALVRAVFGWAGVSPDPEVVSALVYEVEKQHHGTPSGIDNTVIAYERPIRFVRGQPPVFLSIMRPFTLMIADSGIPSPTRETVAAVRRGWEREPDRYERLFDAIAALVKEAEVCLATGRVEDLGPLLNANHTLLQELGVSSPILDDLVQAAREAGALGAKLTGGGRGGNLIALVSPDQAEPVARALQAAGARAIYRTEVPASSPVDPLLGS
ncbi:mevalonate kinase [Thermoflexus sp.]|uniref:mevalonate kinase n=1 Tax=Thermoflexus sp. TaxID=1969742 RepID=UPI0026052CF1|nr:mevalonate kinase [Thermoflexus sp.]MCX7690060.1 mevalonate kinase [Thermoflexus sp.]